MYLAQVEHWWLNDYVTVSASVSGELLPTSVTFHEVTQSINLLTAQVLLFCHEIPVRIGGKTPTHCQWVCDCRQSQCRRSTAACVRVLQICTTHRLVHRRSNCLLNLLAYFVFQTLSVAADRIWRIRLGKRAAVQRTTASALGPLFTTFCACAHNCIYIPRMREV